MWCRTATQLLPAMHSCGARRLPIWCTTLRHEHDHGHLPSGGHGDAEPAIRLVRACLIGPGFSPGPRDAAMTLPDLSRTLFELLGVAPAPDAAGRTLAVALRNPAVGATLPRISTRAWLMAPVLLLARRISRRVLTRRACQFRDQDSGGSAGVTHPADASWNGVVDPMRRRLPETISPKSSVL